MKKTIITISITLLIISSAFWQKNIKELFSAYTPANSTYGYDFPAKGTYRILTVFVNIIYDADYTKSDPKTNNKYWPVSNKEGINELPPKEYFDALFDVNSSTGYGGFYTRFFNQASFGAFILLSDFTCVEIKASRIGAGGQHNFVSKLITYINQNGGLQTIYGHNSISDYDKTERGNKKQRSPNNKIDYVNIIVRNPNKKLYGFSTGGGYGNISNSTPLLLADGEKYRIENGTIFGVGHKHLLYEPVTFSHEFAHALLGGNSFHTSGSNHYGTRNMKTFMGHQYGYGLFNFGLRSVNAYERWRLAWQSESNSAYAIAANGKNSNITSRFEGTKSFYLRDFLTYGDAIRIKLPYKDNELSSNQYVWLENHQIGRNSQTDIDIIQYSNFPGKTCIPEGKPGIYAYIQIGKDKLSGYRSSVFPGNETDNLRMISAEGNYNVVYTEDIKDCLGWGNRANFKYISENPLSGANDQTQVFKYKLLSNKIQALNDFSGLYSKTKNDSLYNHLPYHGDNLDAFGAEANGSVMDIGTNPPPVNATTYYSYYYKSGQKAVFKKVDNKRDTRKKHLTGLTIKMTEDGENKYGKIIRVDIGWNDYRVKNNVNWAGDIVLHEELIINENKKIILEQNLSPTQLEKDSVSGFFAPPTFFTCNENSKFTMNENSKLILKDLSSFIMQAGSNNTLKNGAVFEINSGSTLLIRSGANLTLNKNAKIIVKNGGYICIEEGTDITIKKLSGRIILKKGAIKGSNPQLFPESDCRSKIKR